MKKSYVSGTDVRSEGSDARRLYRAVCDTARRLDDYRGRAETCSDLFSPTLEAQRMKLRDYCERLMFSDSTTYARKAEELLWRKGYYDVLSTAKQLKLDNDWTSNDVAYIKQHLSAGIGHYYHLIHKLQIDFKIDVFGMIDFPVLIIDEGLTKGKTTSGKRQPEQPQLDWALQCIHHCLLYLGDLNRYIVDLDQPWNAGIAFRYYMQALRLNHEVGMPHNQLGTLAGSKNFCLDAAYHYMRCLTCPQSFEGAEGNLQRLFAKNAAWLDWHNKQEVADRSSLPKSENVHCFISRMLLLLDIWFFEVSSVSDPKQLNDETLRDLKECLSYQKNMTDSATDFLDVNGGASNHLATADEPEYLTDDMVFKMAVMLLLCIAKLRAAGSQKLGVAVAFTITIFQQLLQHIMQHVEQSLINLQLLPISSPSMSSSPDPLSVKSEIQNNGVTSNAEAVKRKKERRKRRLEKLRSMRRKRRGRDSEDSSDLSETEARNGLNLFDDDDEDDEDETSDLSELDHVILSDEDDLLNISTENASDKVEDGKRRPIKNVNAINKRFASRLVNGGSLDSENSISTASTCDSSISGSQDVSNMKLSNDTSDSVGVSKENEVNSSVSSRSNNSLRDEKNCNNDELLTKNKELPNSKTESDQTSSKYNVKYCNGLDVNTIIDIVSEEGLFAVIKIFMDWLRGEPGIFNPCGDTLRQILFSLISVLNVINISVAVSKEGVEYRYLTRVKSVEDSFHKIPLPEDIEVRGLAPVKESQQELDWNYFQKQPISSKDEVVLRALKLVDFGHFLTTVPETGVVYNEEHKLFIVSDEPSVSSEKEMTSAAEPQARQGQLSHNMTRLWLREKVKDLESRERRRSVVFSPYVVLDAAALINHMYKVKQLANSRKFIVLIPSIVVSALDELKRSNGRAREAIRWLEIQFQKGNRFLKAQRSHEHASLPLIKYPKKKDKEAWLFFQVLECCYYFSRQTNLNENQNSQDTSFVTLLTGHQEDAVKDFSPLGVAKSAGIHMEDIDSFFTKWKSSTKSHG